MYSPQTDLATQIAQIAGQYGQSVFDWAGNTYNSQTGVTNDAINNYMNMANSGANLAATTTADYNNLFRPEYQRLDALAKDYASPARQAMEMGRAESGVAQGVQSGLDNARKNLQSYGIDPSSGRYQELETAQNAAAGAAEAGAAEEARRATENTGIQLLENSMNYGQQLPGDTVNALNIQGQGIAGSENANLANSSVGTQLMGAANPYLGTGVALKYAPVGQASQSTSASNAASTSASNSLSNSLSSSQGTGSGSQQQSSSGVGYSAYPLASGTGGIKQGAGAGGSGTNYPAGNQDYSGAVPGGTNYPGTPQQNFGAPAGGASTSGITDPAYSGITGDTLGGYDPYAGAGTSYSQPYNSQYYDPYSAYGTAGTSTSQPYDSSFYSPYSAGSFDTGSSGFTSSDPYGGFAQGGAIPDEGGQVPMGASPSQGMQTDDVPARLNAGEFVVPKDVAAWKGHEFFQKLIDQSRKARTMGSAQASMKPALPNQHRPSYVSQGAH